ncbi:MAG: transposase, partial [Herbaspirillum sp.]|nr:transposase [Herbaspirillum sp.]
MQFPYLSPLPVPGTALSLLWKRIKLRILLRNRRNKCGIPEDIIFKSKPELAAEMYRDTVGRDAVPFRYVVADTVYGN